jgi:hypothetical protein
MEWLRERVPSPRASGERDRERGFPKSFSSPRLSSTSVWRRGREKHKLHKN